MIFRGKEDKGDSREGSGGGGGGGGCALLKRGRGDTCNP